MNLTAARAEAGAASLTVKSKLAGWYLQADIFILRAARVSNSPIRQRLTLLEAFVDQGKELLDLRAKRVDSRDDCTGDTDCDQPVFNTGRPGSISREKRDEPIHNVRFPFCAADRLRGAVRAHAIRINW